jgi:hypothetical protein
MVVLVNAWIVAVAERAAAPRGLRTPRFPLGKRVLSVEPSMLGAGLFLLGLVALCTRSWEVTAWVALIFSILGIEAMRRAAWYLVPAAAVIQGLLTMSEFHTLGDLLGELSGGIAALAWMLGQALFACGPLLRTDAGALGWFGRVVAMIASLPGYLAAGWLAGHVPAAAALPAPVLFLGVLLVGGIVQSLILAAMSFAVSVRDRPAQSASPAAPYRVGLALLPIFLPLVFVAALPIVPWPEGSFAAVADTTPQVWTAAVLMLLLVPAVPAAALVGAALDRVDGCPGTRWASTVALGGLAAWLGFGPQLLPRLLAPEGAVTHLAALCGLGQSEVTVQAMLEVGAAGVPPELFLLGLPAGELSRAVTVLVLAAAMFAACRVRHASPGGRHFGWAAPAVLFALGAGAAFLLAPRMGPAGMAFGFAGACAVMLVLDLVMGEAAVPQADSESTLVPDQHDRRVAGESGALSGGRRADDPPVPAPSEEPRPAPAPTLREAIT